MHDERSPHTYILGLCRWQVASRWRLTPLSYGELLDYKLGGQDSWVTSLRMSSISASSSMSFSSITARLEMVSQGEWHRLKYEVNRNTRGKCLWYRAEDAEVALHIRLVPSSTRSASGETTMEWLDKSCWDFRNVYPKPTNGMLWGGRLWRFQRLFWASVARVLITAEALLEPGLALKMAPCFTSEISKWIFGQSLCL